MELNYHDPRPIYEQLVDTFEKLILQGAIAPDEKMPTIRETAAKFSVNPNTVQKVFAILESDGYIYTVKGRGSFAADPEPLLEKRRTAFLSDFRATVHEGISLGIAEKEMKEAVSDTYREGAND
ncbi:MAG: GntR family transcriptional regulator [Lachnospiraceae bacterium]|nr:GntR family transcriptional regulator [Lachnospiraceae bacterium]